LPLDNWLPQPDLTRLASPPIFHLVWVIKSRFCLQGRGPASWR
jgi:hypothetical protein